MLGRHARIHLQTHRISWVAHRKPHLIVITPLVAHRPSSSRQFSLSNITEPLNKAAGQLPDILQHQIPETVLNLSEAWVPTSLPTYTTGIFVFAVLTRLCFFTPWAYWVCHHHFKVTETSSYSISWISSKFPLLTFPVESIGIGQETKMEIARGNRS